MGIELAFGEPDERMRGALRTDISVAFGELGGRMRGAFADGRWGSFL